jgi:ketosteroid isomerase-like protein
MRLAPTKQILEADRRRIEAMIAADEEELECFFTEDLVYTHTNGVADTKATLIDKIRTGSYDYTGIETDDILVRPIGDRTAVLTGHAVLGVRTPHGEKVDVPIRFTSVYVKDGTSWKMMAWQSTRAG